MSHVFKCTNCGREWDVHSASELDCFFRGLCYDCLTEGYTLKVFVPVKTHDIEGSTSVAKIAYSHKERKLLVTFNTGATYEYSGVPLHAVGSLFRSKSRGKALHKFVKSKGYAYKLVHAEVPHAKEELARHDSRGARRDKEKEAGALQA